MRDLPITVVVPTKNEEANLARCLQKLSRFGEVVVVDSASTDATPAIAKAHGAKLVNFVWNGAYPKKRNWLLLNDPPTNEWVLFLDADEFVTEAFCDAAAAALRSEPHSGYWLHYSNYFLRRPLRHGLPQRKLALFKVGAGLYERIDEAAWSKLDMEVHEHPEIAGSVGEIRAPIVHDDDRGIAKFIDRHRDYAAWEARRTLELRRGSRDGAHLTGRQKFKYKNIDAWWYPLFYFLYTYIVRLGLLDGLPGFYYAFQKAWYFSVVGVLIKEYAAAPAAAPQREATEPVMTPEAVHPE
ncbi:MAG: glycosyltransferase family 2 protein [Hyphomonadaceae bacterium]|nr:glycosyltransferase family 2 protein [Hyphomonadaceae bacterium]